MKDIKVMMKKLNLFLVSEAQDEETGEQVFLMMDETTEDIKAYTYTDLVNFYNRKMREQYEF